MPPIGAGGVDGGGGTGGGADCASPGGGVGGRTAHSMTSGMGSSAHFVHTLHDSVDCFKHFSLLYSGPQVSAHERQPQRFPTFAHAFNLFTQVVSHSPHVVIVVNLQKSHLINELDIAEAQPTGVVTRLQAKGGHRALQGFKPKLLRPR